MKTWRFHKMLLIFLPIALGILFLLSTGPRYFTSKAEVVPFLYAPFRIPDDQPFYYMEVMTSVFDHSYPNYTIADKKIIMFNGGVFDDICYSINYDGIYVPDCAGEIQSYMDTADEYPRVYYNGHDGYDWAVSGDVLAAASGTIDFVGYSSVSPYKCLGYIVIINHQNGYRTVYGHMRDSSSTYHQGDLVGVGDVIGQVGNTTQCGTSTGPHLHFMTQNIDILSQWLVVDPFGWYVIGSEDPLADYNGRHSEDLWVDGFPHSFTFSGGPLDPPIFPTNSLYLGGALIIDAPLPTPTLPPPPVTPYDSFELCDGTNFGLPCTPIIYSSNDYCLNLANIGWDNLADSLRFNGNYIGNYEVILYDDNSCVVYNARYGEDEDDLEAFRNAISSLRLEKRESSPTSEDGVALCDGTQYGLPCQAFTYTNNDMCINLANYGWDNRAESLRFLGSYVTGYEIILYDDNSCVVYNARYGLDSADLGAYKNSISSIRIEQYGAPAGEEDGIELCDGTQYGLPCQPFYHRDDSTCQDLSIWGWDNRAESLRFRSNYVGGYDIILYDDNNCNIYNARYGSDDPDLEAYRNTISSIRIEKHDPPPPDLIPQPLTGRAEPIVVSSVPGTTSDGALFTGNPIYIDWGYQNVGQTAAGFHYVELYIDDQRYVRYPFSGLGVGYLGGFADWMEVWISPGWHTVKMVVDPDNNVAESNETNNIWQKQFYWQEITGWRGEYFNNPDLNNPMALLRDDALVDFDWGYDSPDPAVAADNFSARWTRPLFLTQGLYRFYVRHDDGARLYIDDALLLDVWDTCCVVDEIEVEISEGYHEIQVEFRDTGGAAHLTLWWERSSMNKTFLPLLLMPSEFSGSYYPAVNDTYLTPGHYFNRGANITFVNQITNLADSCIAPKMYSEIFGPGGGLVSELTSYNENETNFYMFCPGYTPTMYYSRIIPLDAQFGNYFMRLTLLSQSGDYLDVFYNSFEVIP